MIGPEQAMRAAARLLAAFALALALLLPAGAQGMPPLASGPGERIVDFDADITVADTGDLHVVESITVRVKGEQIQRGIIRSLPLTGGPGSYVVLSVTRDGHDEPYTIDMRQESMDVRIGNPDVLLAHGDATYQITYRASQQVVSPGRTRTLAWNVTGHAWALGIDNARARVHLPAGAAATNLKLFTGPAGSTVSDGTIVQDASGAIVARTRLPLQPGSGLTIAIEWPAAPSDPEPAHTLDGMIRFYTIIGYVFVLPLIVLAL